MKRLTLGFFVLAMALVIAPAALADPFIPAGSSIGIGGGNDYWTLLSSTTPELVFNQPGATIVDESGVFTTSVTGSSVTINSTTFLFSSPDVLVFTTASGTVTLTLTGPIEVSRDDKNYLDISGTGILALPGYAPTLAIFSSDSTDSSGNFGTANSSGFSIVATSLGTSKITPEPSSLLLLGTGLLSFAGILRRKMLIKSR